MARFYRNDGWVKNALGNAIAGASVYVVNQPANTAFVPPDPLASVFSDVNGLAPITQPIFSDGQGHYFFYALSGFYTLVVVTGGTTQQVYQDQTIGLPGTGL